MEGIILLKRPNSKMTQPNGSTMEKAKGETNLFSIIPSVELCSLATYKIKRHLGFYVDIKLFAYEIAV